MISNGKKYTNVIIMIFRIVLFVVLSVFTIFIFYGICDSDMFSDIEAHAVRAEGMRELLRKGPICFFSNSSHTYPLWHVLYLFIRKFMRLISENSFIQSLNYVYLCASLTCTLTIVCLYFACKYTFKKMLPSSKQNLAFLFTWMLIFAGPYIKGFHSSYYLGQGIIVPWHNPTTLAVYPIGILCFTIYFFLVQDEKDRTHWKKWLLFSGLLLLSCLAKPSFYQMFILGIALYCLFELIRSKGKKILFCIYSFVAVLPTCCAALLQMKVEVREPEQALVAMSGTWESTARMVAKVVEEASYGIEIGGIGIEWLKVQKIFSPERPFLSLLLLWIFPIYVIVIYAINRKRNKKMSLPICIAISGTLQYTLLYLAMRPETGDFAWGYYMSMAILFIGCITYFVEICNEKSYKLVKWIGWGLFGGHVFWGFCYAVRLTDPGYIYTLPLF